MADSTCLHCGVTKSYPPSTAAVRKYCGWECRTAVPRNNHPDTSVEWSCEECGKTERRTKSRATANRFCSIPCRDAHSVRLGSRRTGAEVPCKGCGTPIYVVPCLTGRKQYCSRHCANLHKPFSQSKVSRISQEIADLFEQRNPGIRVEREMRINRWSVDMALTDLGVAIEIDGVYWHSLPGIAEKDARKDHHLSSRGWTVLRFPVNREAAIDVVLQMEKRLACWLADERQAIRELAPA